LSYKFVLKDISKDIIYSAELFINKYMKLFIQDSDHSIF